MITEKMLMMYLKDCEQRSRLDWKTIKAYRCDLQQFYEFLDARELDRFVLEEYLIHLHTVFSVKSVQRKLASLHAFFQYLVFYEQIEENPLDKIRTHFQKPFLLPRTIPLVQMQRFFHYLYEQITCATTPYQNKCALRNVAIFELLFSTGLRISELCDLRLKDIDLNEYTVRIYGKGKKERMLSIGSSTVRNALSAYHAIAHSHLETDAYFFLNRNGTRISDQSIRILLHRYCKEQGSLWMTPHMFRHTFASMLLEEEVDIRYIQHILGHSSITTTQIYTHVSDHKQKEILQMKNPRDRLLI